MRTRAARNTLRTTLLAFLATFGVVVGAPGDGEVEVREMRPDLAQWLDDVALLITPAERASFDKLEKDYQRDQFVRKFWDVRDPFPQTARNEFRDEWEANVFMARERFGNVTEDRARVLLSLGAPATVWSPVCHGTLKAMEIWTYSGTERVRAEFALAFYSSSGSRKGPYRLWRPSEGLSVLVTEFVTSPSDRDRLARRVIDGCNDGGDAIALLQGSADWEALNEKFQLIAKVNPEWLQAFEARSTEIPEGAAQLPATLENRFPGRHQSRTVVETLLSVPRSEATPTTTSQPSYAFLVDGEVLLKGELFEAFRYRFDLPSDVASGASEAIPLILQRYLRPGAYTLIVKLEDLVSHRFYRAEVPLDVPTVAAAAAPTPVTVAGAGAPAVSTGAPASNLAEANRELPTELHEVKLFAPSNDLVTGRMRVEAVTAGNGIARLEFWLDGRRVLSKAREPWSVELDLGKGLRTHRVRAAAVDAAGALLASDEIIVNSGPHRFRVRFLQPERGRHYEHSLRASVEVSVPMGEKLERLELFLNEDRVATLYQPPYVQPIVLPRGQLVTYLRAVAYLEGGNSSEDLVFINTPDVSEEIQVSLVELYTSVVDRRGRPQADMVAEDFVVKEDGAIQELRRFERVADVPIHAGVVLDVSGSMEQELGESVRSALRFFESVIEPKDRAAVFTFSDRPSLVVPFTNDTGVLAGGLTKLSADGETALWDAIATALHYFSGVRGKRALIVLSDGEDTRSLFKYEDVLEFAKRAGVAIYPIALGLPSKSADVRLRLQKFAEQTGGELTEIRAAAELGKVYERIERELRSQYLLVYASPPGAPDAPDRFREIEVEVKKPGLEAKTIRGYYP